MPFGTPAGNVKISVKNGSQSVDASDDFTVLAPSITSFSPSSGNAGTLVTIIGVGFNPSTFNNTVKFGTITTTVITSTDTSITVSVPSNLNPGTMKITVVSNGQTVVSSSNFTAI